jgi:ribosomal protein S26
MARKPRISDGSKIGCSKCHQLKNPEEFYYNRTHNTYASQCKPCHNETARESAERKKINVRVRKMIRRAKDRGDTSMVQCKKCKRHMPHSTFKPYDTRVFINDELLLDGYTEMCGYCVSILNDAVFSKINGAIKYAEERRRAKTYKSKVS